MCHRTKSIKYEINLIAVMAAAYFVSFLIFWFPNQTSKFISAEFSNALTQQQQQRRIRVSFIDSQLNVRMMMNEWPSWRVESNYVWDREWVSEWVRGKALFVYVWLLLSIENFPFFTSTHTNTRFFFHNQ